MCGGGPLGRAALFRAAVLPGEVRRWHNLTNESRTSDHRPRSTLTQMSTKSENLTRAIVSAHRSDVRLSAYQLDHPEWIKAPAIHHAEVVRRRGPGVAAC